MEPKLKLCKKRETTHKLLENTFFPVKARVYVLGNHARHRNVLRFQWVQNSLPPPPGLHDLPVSLLYFLVWFISLTLICIHIDETLALRFPMDLSTTKRAASCTTRAQGVRSLGIETLIRALWFNCDAEQVWNQFAFPLSIRCQGKKNGAVQLEAGSDLLFYI